ncbi:MAG: hypothetical protein GX325_10705 [Peptococcaceae bacterium]|nr:hypothetical protein [Peptococcaceae bacterium]
MEKTTEEKSAIPSFMPFNVLKTVEYYFIDEPRIFHMSQLAETFYQEFLRKDYGPHTKEIADWFWWAVRRHIMYRTGELEKDEWYKGSEEFEDFLNIEYKKRYAAAFSFKLAEHELPRLPKKYVKKYFYHRLNNIAYITHLLAEKQIPVVGFLWYEYYKIIPLEVREEYFMSEYKIDPQGEMEKFEELLCKTEEDYEKEKESASGIPKKRIGPKARVYRFPFKLIQETEAPGSPVQKRATDRYLSRFYKSWYNDQEIEAEPGTKTAEIPRKKAKTDAKTTKTPRQKIRRINDRYMSLYYKSWYCEAPCQEIKVPPEQESKTYKKPRSRTKKIIEFLKGLGFSKIFTRKPAWTR